jgi:hypothetical protein
LTLQTKHCLATGLVGAGDIDGARLLFEEVAADFTGQLGPAHPHTQMAVQSVASVHMRTIVCTSMRAWSNTRPAAKPAAIATTVVVLLGLVGAVQHNGKRATVLGFDADRGRSVL